MRLKGLTILLLAFLMANVCQFCKETCPWRIELTSKYVHKIKEMQTNKIDSRTMIKKEIMKLKISDEEEKCQKVCGNCFCLYLFASYSHIVAPQIDKKTVNDKAG